MLKKHFLVPFFSNEPHKMKSTTQRYCLFIQYKQQSTKWKFFVQLFSSKTYIPLIWNLAKAPYLYKKNRSIELVYPRDESANMS